MKCDGIDNCGDNSDEEDCQEPDEHEHVPPPKSGSKYELESGTEAHGWPAQPSGRLRTRARANIVANLLYVYNAELAEGIWSQHGLTNRRLWYDVASSGVECSEEPAASRQDVTVKFSRNGPTDQKQGIIIAAKGAGSGGALDAGCLTAADVPSLIKFFIISVRRTRRRPGWRSLWYNHAKLSATKAMKIEQKTFNVIINGQNFKSALNHSLLFFKIN